MDITNIVTRLPYLSAIIVLLDISPSIIRISQKPVTLLFYVAVYFLATFWRTNVNRIVPIPYLDEIFHIPQAQAYCNGDYFTWDPKLTTPPGLYGISTLLLKIWGNGTCTVSGLRLTNTLFLMATMLYANDCRRLLTRSPGRDHSLSDVYTAANIALFPPLFFFSGLYYTDILSTCVVLRVYKSYLQREGPNNYTIWRGLGTFILCLLALTMRQTNIFWVAVFLGGLEAVRTFENAESSLPLSAMEMPGSWKEFAMERFKGYSSGKIHDVALSDASLEDFALCGISIVVATLFHPILTLTRLTPYISLLATFAAFVVWNGGVVLGDKSNHVATIHLPQMLYIWPFIAFFSAPLLVPTALSTLQDILRTVQTVLYNGNRPQSTYKLIYKLILYTGCIAASLLATLLIIRYNTIIHPFTLADNRHYVFYIFRYTILRHRYIRYALAPIYIMCAYLAYRCLGGDTSMTSGEKSLSTLGSDKVIATSKQDRSAMKATATTTTSTPISDRITASSPRTSFALVLLLSTALSLITAPLVEPRYFIIPWVMWRLHVPLSRSSSSTTRVPNNGAAQGILELMDKSLEILRGIARDYQLLLETAWFLVINAGTGYVFLYRGFEWPQEKGNVQRFMW
ncbi:DIE2/ALG10 family-domain-containing protein [Xylogone sp. PMI_703]|nr:DIE2/ALG10 family-domain-containing protein [Xylogone sp. PMI_703]